MENFEGGAEHGEEIVAEVETDECLVKNVKKVISNAGNAVGRKV